MVKIIGESKKYAKEVACSNCSAELQYTNSDVHSIHGTDYSGGSDGKEYIICPRCQHEVVLRAW